MRIAAFLAALLMLACIAGCPSKQTSSSAPGSSGAGDSSATQTVQVELGQWYVKLNPSTVKAGEVQFTIKNAGTFAHAFVIEGQGIEEKTSNIAPGQSAVLTVTLKSGTYDAYCPIDGHKGLGMNATLTVK